MPNEPQGEEPSVDYHLDRVFTIAVDATLEQRIAALEAKSTNQSEANSTKEILPEIKRGERWLIGLNAVSIVVSAIIGLIYWFQLREMVGVAGQTDALTRSYRVLAGQAGIQAAQTTRLAGETHDLAESSKKEADATRIIAENAGIQAAATQKAASAAESAANTAVENIRPLIKIKDVELRPGGKEIKTLGFHWPFTGKTIPPLLQIKVTSLNVGHSPAENVQVSPELFFARFDSTRWHDLIIAEEHRFCSQALQNLKRAPDATNVFPEEPLESDMGVGGLIRPADVVDNSGVESSSAALIVCVTYKGVGPTPYQTRAWFGLYEDNLILIPINVDASKDHLRLIRESNGDESQ